MDAPDSLFGVYKPAPKYFSEMGLEQEPQNKVRVQGCETRWMFAQGCHPTGVYYMEGATTGTELNVRLS